MTQACDVMEIHEVPYDHPDSTALVDSVQAYYVSIYGGPDNSPVDGVQFARPRGAFFLGYLGSCAVAMGGWRIYPHEVDIDAAKPAEIKRMYVATANRGRGFARRMLAHLELSARESGADAMVLETGSAQPEAIALYRSAGYVDIPHFGHYACAPDAVHLGKVFGHS